MKKYNKLVFITAAVITLLAGLAMYSDDVDGWKLPAIMILIFAAIYGTAKKPS